MKKWGIVLGTSVILVLSVWLYVEWATQRYIPQDDFYGFLVPKAATLDNEKEHSMHYEWGAATFENGLPLWYQYALKKQGWDKQEPIDTIQVYEKNGQEIQVAISTDYLEIFKMDERNEKSVFTEPEPTEWVDYIQPVRAYMYYRTQATLNDDIAVLWEQYPELKNNVDHTQGINVEKNEVESLNNGLALLDANFDIESYERIKVKGKNEVIVLVHGSIVYMRDDFEESGGEYLLEIHLEKQADNWTVVKTDEYTQTEYKEMGKGWD